MQFIKTICVLVVLGALAYGAYTTLTGKPKQDPPGETANWDSPPRIELPGGNDVASGTTGLAPTGPAGGSAPKYGESGNATGAARITPATGLTPPPFSAAAPPSTTNSAATAGAASPTTAPTVPSSYPKTNAMPGPFDGHGAVHLVTNIAEPSTAPQGTALATATSPTPPINAVDAFSKGQAAVAQQNYLLALDELSKCFDNASLSPNDASKLQDLLDQLAGTVIYSREHLIEPAHVVAQGETLQSIAQKHSVSVGLLAKINGIADPLYLPAGTQLKMVKGPFDAVVDKSHGKVVVFCDTMYAGSFPLASGFDFPDGNYTVEKLEKGMSLSPVTTFPPQPAHGIQLNGGLSILGTDQTSWPAAADPRSGVRGLSLRDADDLCDILTVGSKVVVRK